MFGCLRGIFVLLNVLGGFFVSFENVSNLDWSVQKLEDMEYPSFHKKKILADVLSLHRDFQETGFLFTIIAISW